MFPKLFQILLNDNTVTNLLGTNPLRVFPFSEAPQNVTYPYVTYTVFNGHPENYLNQTPDVDRLGTQIDVWAETGKSCREVAKAIAEALQTTNHITRTGNQRRDDETKAYRISLDLDMFTFR